MPTARKVPKLHKKTISIRNGTKFTDLYKHEFIIGNEIGQGGFGRIYEGTQVHGNYTSYTLNIIISFENISSRLLLKRRWPSK
jgi:hypothetical protein